MLLVSIPANVFGEDISKTAGPSSASECAICHIDWIADFKRKGAETLIPHRIYAIEKSGKQKVSSTSKLCFTCHDGYINDSRFQFREGAHEHPIGVKPSKKIRIKKSKDGEIYPLNEDGKLYCGTCHTAHGNDWNSSESAIFMRSKNVDSSLCIDCHANHTGEDNNNHPTAKFKGKTPKLIRTTRSRFGKKKKVICQTCHVTHDSSGDNLLVMGGKKSKLCVACHTSQKNIIGSEHDMSKHKGLLSRKTRKAIKESGSCAGCHVSHGGNIKPLLAIDNSNKKITEWDQCVSCHSEDGIAGETSIGHYSHPVDVSIKKVNIQVVGNQWISPLTEKKIITLPLYDLKGNRVEYDGNVRCATCHDTHNVANTGKNFLRIEQGKNSKLCTNCHLERVSVITSKHNINLYSPAQLKKVGGNAGKGLGICSTCHSTHQGKAQNMLTLVDQNDKHPVSLLNSVCTHCHSKNGAASNSVMPKHSHPNNIKLSEGMQPLKLPVFSKNGKRVTDHRKGKMECATCHNVHQWDVKNSFSRAKGILKAKANSGNSFLRLAANGGSQLCISCHESEEQIIKTDHDFRVSAHWLENKYGETASESGVCGQCHTAHPEKESLVLWSRKPGKARDVQASLCRSCHIKNHKETNKTVPMGKHPKDSLVWSLPKRRMVPGTEPEAIPLFDKEGKRTDLGLISCPTCHNPHQWDGTKIGKGPGVETEGTSMSSFLRKTTVGNIVCADCHGLDGLFRYQYFHSKTNTMEHPLYLD